MSHECGYTGFDVRLDNATGIRFGLGKQNQNVLTLRADASFGSGEWPLLHSYHPELRLRQNTNQLFQLSKIWSVSVTQSAK